MRLIFLVFKYFYKNTEHSSRCLSYSQGEAWGSVKHHGRCTVTSLHCICVKIPFSRISQSTTEIKLNLKVVFLNIFFLLFQRQLFYSFLMTIHVIIRLNSLYCFPIVDFWQKKFPLHFYFIFSLFIYLFYIYSTYLVFLICFHFFLKNLVGPRSILWSHWLPLFWTSSDPPHGFYRTHLYL